MGHIITHNETTNKMELFIIRSRYRCASICRDSRDVCAIGIGAGNAHWYQCEYPLHSIHDK